MSFVNNLYRQELFDTLLRMYQTEPQALVLSEFPKIRGFSFSRSCILGGASKSPYRIINSVSTGVMEEVYTEIYTFIYFSMALFRTKFLHTFPPFGGDGLKNSTLWSKADEAEEINIILRFVKYLKY